MQTITFWMNDLSCPSCIKKIEGALLKQKGVVKARVLFSSGKGVAVFNQEFITEKQLMNIVQKLGYQVMATKVH